MNEDKLSSHWTRPIIISVLLIAAIIAQEPTVEILSGRAVFVVGKLWNLANMALAWVAWVLWNNRIKLVESFSAPKREKYRSSVAFFAVFIFIGAGCAASFYMFGGEKFLATSNRYLLGLFGVIWALLVARGLLIAFVRLLSGKGDELKKRLATGYADGAIIALLGVSQLVRLDSHHIRVAILAAVITAIRVGWGYVPEERLEIVQEFILFLQERKLWWMTPIFIILGLMVVLVLLTEVGGGAFPFIYAVF